MVIKSGCFVQINQGQHYYDVGIVEDTADEGIYVYLFNFDGSLDDFTSRYSRYDGSVKAVSVDVIANILIKDAIANIYEELNKLE